jgi:hypothetical protein
MRGTVSMAQNIHTLLIPSQPEGSSRSNPLPQIYCRNLQAPRTMGQFCNAEHANLTWAKHGPGGLVKAIFTRGDEIMAFWLTRATQSNMTVTRSRYEFFVTRLLPGHSTVGGHPTITGSHFGFSLP